MEQLEGLVVHVVYQNEQNGYTVAHLKRSDTNELEIIVGTFPRLSAGEQLTCEGEWKTHKKFGKQFEVKRFEVQMPTTVAGITDYLASGIIHGVRRQTATKIVGHFGLQTFAILDNDPERVAEVPGISKKKAAEIAERWAEQRQARDVIVFLQQHGVSVFYAQKIYQRYGHESMARLLENPYNLADEVVGIAFLKADSIAKAMGIASDSRFRVEAGVLYMLKELSNQGHTAYWLDELVQRATAFLEVDTELVSQAVGELLKTKRIAVDGLYKKDGSLATSVWLRALYEAERQIAEHLKRLLLRDSEAFKGWKKALENTLNTLNIALAPQQTQAVITSLKHKVHIITGGAGTGKSTIINVLVKTLKQKLEKIILAAPTGRAAKRISEVTQAPASTIHSLLAMQMQGLVSEKAVFQQLEADVVIVDEVSMVDTALMSWLLKSIGDKTRLILVGDADQLPSVGAGNVLKDLMASGLIPVTRLTEIFRQGRESYIVQYAHQINQGEMPTLANDKLGDFFFLEENRTESVAPLIQELVCQRLPKAYKLDMLREIQVLSPMNKGALGTRALNQLLQPAPNPQSSEENSLLWQETRYAVGDKVIQTRNNYDKLIFNGDIGFVTQIDKSSAMLTIDFEGRELEFKLSECQDLELAYAISVHKYQGSECPAVVIPLHESHYKLLYRNLLYTAVTRGKKLVLLVGSKRALWQAIENNSMQERITGLLQLLQPATYARLPAIQLLPMPHEAGYAEFVEKHGL